jgi:DNA repair protein RadA/Sms
VDCDSILFSSERNIESLLNSLKKIIKSEAIKMLIFDSLQGLYSENNEGIAGSVSQSKEVLIKIMEFSKQNKVISVVVGHITKGGEIAGPKFLEHMVDCVLFLEGEKNSNLRMLRSFKNRYGSVAEVGFFEMETTGLKEVKNPSQFFLDWNEANMGKTAVGVKKGMRIVFATIESLVVSSSLAFPKRIAKGINAKRLELILAILKKYLKLQTDKYDIYVNVTGGLQINDPLADLAVAASIFSSLASKEFSKKTLFIGEVGLLGNIRPTQAFGQIAKEAKRLGFETIYSANNLNDILKLKTLVK